MVDDTTELFEELRRTGRRRLRNRIVEEHMGLAVHIAKRFHSGAGRDDDLEQVAMVALVKAVDRFDPDVGVPFSAFAGRTIEGEIKRHFRDATWAVKVPRGAKDLHVLVRRANDELSARLGRSPTVAEVAAHLEIDRDDVITGLSAGIARRVGSIDPGPDDDGGSDRNVATAMGERGFQDVENETVVRELIAGLPEREQEIVRLRFYEELSQSEIADRVGVSQMHVSRLLRKAFAVMRDEYVGDDEHDDAATR
jgi:RNA polymerase sigma-B factor